MEGVHAVASIPVGSGHVDSARSLLAQLAKNARQEEGNLQFDVCESASVPGTFIAIERWATQEAFDAHLQSPSLGAVMGELGPLLTGSVDVHVLIPVT